MARAGKQMERAIKKEGMAKIRAEERTKIQAERMRKRASIGLNVSRGQIAGGFFGIIVAVLIVVAVSRVMFDGDYNADTLFLDVLRAFSDPVFDTEFLIKTLKNFSNINDISNTLPGWLEGLSDYLIEPIAMIANIVPLLFALIGQAINFIGFALKLLFIPFK